MISNNHTLDAVKGLAGAAPDDMHDRPEQWPLLAARLEECSKTLMPVYDRAGRAALRHQRQHQWLTKVAAAAGTIAVVVVILGLAVHQVWPTGEEKPVWLKGESLDFIEAFAVLAALLAVALGLLASHLDRWLIERHKAERCRLLKFAFLIDPVVWGDDPQKAADRLRRLREGAAALDAARAVEESQQWLAQIHRPAFLTEMWTYRGDRQLLQQLVAYYRATRLHAQIAYFGDRIARFKVRDHLTRVLPQWLFFASVIGAFVHFVLVLAKWERPLVWGVSAALLAALVAALLPVLGAGIRTYRLANEFGRNIKRFESTRHVLAEMNLWLEEGADARTVFLTLWGCEHTLELEHREWLRLMADTEWFG